MKRLTAVLLAVLMLVSTFMLAACNNDPAENSGSDTSNSVEVNNNDGIYNGNLEKDYRDEGMYTSLDYIGGTTGLNWNPHVWETSDDSYVLGYITTGLYDFVLNEDMTGYTIIPEAAAAMPVDVTADYVGQYGIVEGESAKAWKIALNPLMTWNDGTKINAETYVYSMKQLLDPIALNRRADSFYSGDFEIVNAKNYLYSGKTIQEDNSTTELFTLADLVKGEDGVYTTADGRRVMIAVDASLSWLSGNSLSAYVNSYGAQYFGMDAWASLIKLKGEDGYIAVTDESIDLLEGVITAVAAWGETREEVVQYMLHDSIVPATPWDEVGIKALDEYTILIVTASSVEEPTFYLPYNLSSPWLVKQDLYEACQTWYDAEGNKVAAGAENATSITNTYCTDVATTASYGPYKLTYYELDKQITFERDNAWYGYSDGKHYGQFQTDKISCQVIEEHKTAVSAFLAGEIDGVGMDATDMEKYASSDRLVYTPQDYTTKISFNTNKEKLEEIGRNAVILTIPEFREAFSLALDREKFCSENFASHEPGYGMLNYMYCYNPFTGELYRESEHAQKALVDLYGIEYGEGKDYADIEEAYNAITGYDPTKANELMKTAAQKALDEGLWDGESEIVLNFRQYASDEVYVKMFNFFDESIKKVCEGTAFEGKISLEMTEDPDYYTTMYSGNATIIFTTWGGAAMSPFTLMYQCYCDAADGSGNQMEYGFETDKIMVDITVEGTALTASLQDWAHWCNGDAVEAIDSKLGKFTDHTYDVRCQVFATLEYTYLDSFVTVPIYYRNSASLLSRKVENASDTYLQLVGYGGIRFTTYNYTDAEWDAAKGNITY